MWSSAEAPGVAAIAAAILFGSGLILGGIGLALRQSWLVFLGMGVVGGMGCGLGYIAPVSTLVKWFPGPSGHGHWHEAISWDSAAGRFLPDT